MAAPLIPIDVINKRMPQQSYLTAIEYHERLVSKGGSTRSRIKCLCVCGKFKICVLADLLRGNPMSCGCKRKGTDHIVKCLYNRWVGMRTRCYNKNGIGYSDYGGRGVRVCDEWINDFQAFKEWSLNNGFKPTLQIDKDILGNGLLYSPSTCKWVTPLENMSKTRSSVYYSFRNEMLTIPQISRLTGILQSTLKGRIKSGNTIEEATGNFIFYSNP